jgi:hypothetical protein
MKQLILSATLFAFVVAVQAGETKTCNDKEKAGCCSQAKATAQAKECPMAKELAKSGCSGGACKATPTKQQALMSPKAAAELAKK